MKITVILCMSLLLLGSYTATYQGTFLIKEVIQKEYKTMRIQTISTLIPAITPESEPNKKVLVDVQKFFNITETDAQVEMKEYEENYKNFTLSFFQWQGKSWKADPELSAVFDLTSNSKNESFIVKGRENSILIMDISVSNLDTLINNNDGITVFVTNLSGLNEDLDKLAKEQRANRFQATLMNNIEYKVQVKKHLFISIPFSSDIYQIWVVRQPKDNQKFTGVHVSFQMGIEEQPSLKDTSKVNLTPQQQEQMVKIMKEIVEQNNLTFLDSLQLWEKVDQHRRQHERSYEWNEAVELYECMGLLLMYVVEYVVLRFIAKKKQVV